jgi:hypothetical protein
MWTANYRPYDTVLAGFKGIWCENEIVLLLFEDGDVVESGWHDDCDSAWSHSFEDITTSSSEIPPDESWE